MRKNIFVIFAAILILSMCGVSFAADELIQLRCGGSGQTSWAYSCMVAISEAVKQHDPNMEIIVQTTPGSTSHYGLFDLHELDLGNGFTPTDYWSNIGLPPFFDKKYEGAYYVIAPTSISKVQVMTHADSDIKSLKDLNGKKVFFGDQGSSSTNLVLHIIETLGIKCDGIQTDRTEGYQMFSDGRVDALFAVTGVPYASVLELATTVDLKIVPFSDEEIEACVKTGPYCFNGSIVPSEYSFVKEPTKTLVAMNNILARADLDNDVAYRLAKNITEVWGNVMEVIPSTRDIDPLRDIIISVAKIHPGALKYYEERGVKIPDNLKP